jgi:RNA polymerase-binding transcription factor DksA
MDNTIQNAKLELIQWLTTLEDSSLIQKIMDIRKSETQDWWDEISETEKKSIEQGLMDAEKGKLKPNSEAEKIYGRWL